MNNQFLTDLWHDLRQKHMVPVAVLLGLALVAVPVVLRKHADPPPPAPAPQVAQVPSELVALQDVPTTQRDSQLGTFNPEDPFAPKGGSSPAPSKSLVPTDSLASSTSSSAPSSSGGGGGAEVASTAAGSGSSGGSGGSSSSPGSAPTPSPTVRTRTRTRTRAYTYVADLSFGRRGEERLHKGVERLSALPSTRNPLLVFLGISASRKQAVFLVDSTVSQSGEGTCRPDVRHCTFLYLSLKQDNDEHFFTDAEGTDYGLRLDGIRRVAVSQHRKRKPARGASASSAPAGRPTLFHYPLFADEQLNESRETQTRK